MKISPALSHAAAAIVLAAAPVAYSAAPETGTCTAVAYAIKGSDVDALAAALAKKPGDLNTPCIGTGARAQTPLALVVSRFDNDTARAISGKDSTIEAHNRRMEQMLSALIAAGADVNRREPADGTTPLLLAVMSGSETAVRLLLSVGADPNAKLRNGISTLAMAEAGEPETKAIVAMLKKAGAKD